MWPHLGPAHESLKFHARAWDQSLGRHSRNAQAPTALPWTVHWQVGARESRERERSQTLLKGKSAPRACFRAAAAPSRTVKHEFTVQNKLQFRTMDHAILGADFFSVLPGRPTAVA